MRYGHAVGLVLLAGVVWSLMGLVQRQIETPSTWAILFWRSAGAVPVLMAWIAWRARGNPWPVIRGIGGAGLSGGLALVVAFAGSVYAIQSTTVANAVFLYSGSPIIAALLGWMILREQVRPTTWVAILVAVCGMYIMVRESLSLGAMDGNIGALFGAAGFGAFTVALRWGRLGDSSPIVLVAALLSMAASFAVLRWQGLPVILPLPDIGWGLTMGALCLATGMILFTLGSRLLPAAEATLLSFTEILLAPVWVFLFLGETASPATFVGGGVLLAAVAVNAVLGTRSRTAEGLAKAP